MPALLSSVPSVSSVSSVDSEFSEEFYCSRNLRTGQSGRRAFVKLTGGEGREEKSFLQNEPIMSFRINERNGFVLGLIGFVWLKKPLESQPRPPIEGCRRGRMEGIWSTGLPPCTLYRTGRNAYPT